MSKAPGKSHRIGITLFDAMQKFATVEQAEAWFIEQRWPNGVTCPVCESTDVAERPTRKPQPFRCRSCRKDFSVTVGTLLHRSHIPLNKWAIAFYLYSTNLKGVSSMKLHRDLGITQKSAWYMAHRIREAWDSVAEKFAGPVEADETYIGGEETNKHLSKKLNAGRGVVGKTPVVGVRDRETGKVKTQVVRSTDKESIHTFLGKNVKAGATVYHDNHRSYQSIPFHHEAVNHTAKQYVDGMAHTNGIESVWSMLKRGFNGTYHHWSVKHCERYVREFEGRHNARPMDTADQMATLAKGIGGKRLPYNELIAKE